MKRMYVVLFTCLACLFPLYERSAQAAVSFPLLEDAFYSVLFPQINREVEKHYGSQKKYDCPTITTMKKLYSGTYVFQCKIAVIKYEQKPGESPEPPFERVTITFSNEDGEWEVKDTHVERLPNDTKLTCRKPV